MINKLFQSSGSETAKVNNNKPQLFSARALKIGVPGLTVCLSCVLLAVNGTASAQIGNSATESVISTSGEYSFYAQQYTPVTLPGTLDETLEFGQDAIAGGAQTISGARNFINQVTSFGSWLSFNGGNSFVGVSGGAPLRGQILALRNDQVNLRKMGGVKLGIFILDDLTIGMGGMYSEYSGVLPKGGGGVKFKAGLGDQDPWAAMVWGSLRLTTYVTNTFALSISPSAYWLPLEGKVGYSAFNGFLGLGNGQIFPQALLEAAYRTDLGQRWHLTIQESLQAVMSRRNILDEGMLLGASVRDMSYYDTAGRYAFGGFAPPMNYTTSRDDISLNNNFFRGGSTLFRNQVSAGLNGNLGENTSARFYYARQDGWDDQFNHFAGWNRIGATITQSGQTLSKYAGYSAMFSDSYGQRVEMAYAGVAATLRSNLTAWASAGYMWTNGVNERNSTLWRAALEHQIGPATWQGLSVGRTITDPDFGALYVGDFYRYFIAHNLSSKVEMRLMAQHVEAERVDTGLNSDYNSDAVGALISYSLGDRDSLVLFNSYEKYDSFVGQGWEFWTHRLSYFHQFAPDLEAQMYYQFQHGEAAFGNASGGFNEHLLYLGMAKRF